MRTESLLLPLVGLLLAACGTAHPPVPVPHGSALPAPPQAGAAPIEAASAALPAVRRVEFPSRADEPRLTNLRRLTHGGQNAEAYFSADGSRLIFQAALPGGEPCDQIFVMNVDGTGLQRVSSGTGRTTCGYFYPSGERVLFSSTHHRSAECPPPPDRTRGYVWPLHPYDIFVANPDGTGLRQLTDHPGYDAEATISPDGSRIVFTSDRDGDLELYVMDADGGNVRRLTHDAGYDGGAFFSPDGSRIVYRAHHPTDPAELADYRALLRERLIRPGQVEIWVMDADGSNKRQVTRNGAANFAPFFHPNGRQIIFSSNLDNPGGRDFDLYLIDVDGTGLERVTHAPGFDGFPMFSPDGRTLVWGSHRGGDRRESDLFLADWNELPATSARE
jgi:TolB protein